MSYKQEKTSEIPIINLFGTEEENFYQLGLKDRKQFNISYQAATHLFGIRASSAQKLIHYLIETLSPTLLGRHRQLSLNIKAYAEGVKAPVNQVCASFLIPEILSSISKFTPNVAQALMGCSSVFYFDQHMTHLRTLDFPLNGTFDKNRQVVNLQLPEQTISYSTAKGLPYPSLTAMNESGITLGLHQKFNKFFDPKGTPVFEIAKNIMTHARNLVEVREILKELPSMAGWGLYLSHGQQIMEVDLHGHHQYINEYELEPGQFKYFCNVTLSEHQDFKDVIPYGIQPYNHMRSVNFCAYLDKKKKVTLETLIKAMTTSYEKVKGAAFTPLTSSTVDYVCLTPSKEKMVILTGEAPLSYENTQQIIENCFQSPETKYKKGKIDKKNIKQHKALFHIGQVTKYSLKMDLNKIFHHLQLAIHFSSGQYRYDLLFFYHAYEYIYCQKKDELNLIYRELVDVQPYLSPYLRDQCSLFLNRIEIICSLPYQEREIKHPQLQELSIQEKSWNENILWHKRKLYVPRIEILDIVYPLLS